MLKKDMALRIATALYPESYRPDSPAVQGTFASLMKCTKSNLEAMMYNADKVHDQRDAEMRA